ncbi:MAG TPA: RluA family pseudouridine synthase [Candidatus Tidjanibacter gallistercoris]|nr:RluA family pseudouridine synthase [Candidatus Tidjanibacter gallistercoris]
MEYKVTAPGTLLPFLLEAMAGRSRSAVKSCLTHGRVSVNGCRTTRHDTPLRAGDTVAVSQQKTAGTLRHPMLRVLYEDEYLIVADKRNGLLSVGTDKEQVKTAFRILSDYIKRNDPAARLFVVHRLDRETSGLIIYAKDQTTQEMLQRNWKDAVRDRRYAAVTEGRLPESKGTITTLLREDRSRKMWASLHGTGEKAVTDYSVLRQGKDYALVELSLRTGKKNQIRAHMEWMGTPIAGDRKYGARTNPAGRVCLHAYQLCFVHPRTGGLLDFSTGIPRLFEETVV